MFSNTRLLNALNQKETRSHRAISRFVTMLSTFSIIIRQKPATYIFNSFSEMTWKELLLEKNKFKCPELITIPFV